MRRAAVGRTYRALPNASKPKGEPASTRHAALLPLLLAGGVWALFCAALAAAGHAPSRQLVPIPREHYYAAQALFVLPLLLAQWQLCTRVAHGVARAMGGVGRRDRLAPKLAGALGLPLLCLFLLPDVVGYLSFGFGALGKIVRVTAPLSFVATLLLATRAIRSEHALSVGCALCAALAGVLAQAALGAPLLR